MSTDGQKDEPITIVPFDLHQGTNRATMKNQNRSIALGWPAMKSVGGFNYFVVDQSSPLVLP